MKNELWADAVGYEDLYQVSTYGNVYSKRTGKVLSPPTTSDGYIAISSNLPVTRKKIFLKVHRLVCETFRGSPPEEMVKIAKKTKHKQVLVNHKNGIKNCNRLDNLEWATNSMNTQHAWDTGLFKRRQRGE